MALSEQAKKLLAENPALCGQIAIYFYGTLLLSDEDDSMRRLWSDFVKQNSEPQKDYEILAMYVPDNPNRYFKKYGEFFGCGKEEADNCKRTEKTLFDIGYIIHSVRRSSDGEIFTVGDEVKCEQASGHINHFTVCNTILDVYVKENLTFCLPIRYWKKSKPVLFTTFDNVAVKDGDVYWVDKTDWTTGSALAKDIALNKPTYDAQYLYFSTREAAEDYRLMKRPCLCASDLLDLYNYGMSLDSFRIRIIETAKQKLK